MSDLISRSALIEELKRQIEHCVVEDVAKGLRHAIITIEEQPIAYDKEAVVKRLEELYNRNNKRKKEAYEELDWEIFDFCANVNNGIYKAIAIVKAGGIDG